MDAYINLDGKIIRSDKPVLRAQSRAARYGDGLFETLRTWNGVPVLWENHTERLYQGMQALGFVLPGYFTPSYLLEQIGSTLLANKIDGWARVRLMVYRSEGGLYDPQNMFPHLIVEAWPLPQGNMTFNENGLVLGVYDSAVKTADAFSAYKHNNFLPYFMGAMHAKANHWNDAILLNGYGRIADTTIANIFWVSNQQLFTIPLTEGPVSGTMRKFIIEHPLPNWPVQESKASVQSLMEADEVFLTNAVYGVRWVKTLQDHSYTPQMAAQLYQHILKTVWMES
jgi:branched-chain amino acid aminotransferase